jgi:hypothetical protein
MTVAGESHPPYHPYDGVTLVGPFWTRRQVATRLGIPPEDVRRHRTLLRIEGRLSVEEVYPAFQLDEARTIRREVEFLARLLKRRVADDEACDWLTRPNRGIGYRTPIEWLVEDGDVDRVLRSLPSPTRSIPGAEALDAVADEDDGGVWPPSVTPRRSGAQQWSPTPVTH